MEKINVAELLKDCPKGMELDCILFDNVTFDRVADDGIWIKHIDSKSCDEHSLYVYNDGSFPIHNLRTKCVIFPKGKTTWDGFVPPCKFKDGDVLVVNYSDGKKKACFENIFILNKPEFYGKWNSYCHLDGVGCFHSKETYLAYDKDNPRFATEEEKEKLFQAIKENGYKWNPGTKTLEKLIVPRFKVGDKIRHKTTNKNDIYEISKVYDDSYGLVGFACMICMKLVNQDDWELVPDKFDITTLKPFDKVLVRTDNSFWRIGFFEKIEKKNKRYPFVCMGYNKYSQCIPYECNEHLLDTTNDCDEFYKTWK